jgi:predicted regulator of Ras-like GTPase activity (Roadblock/LC7/MglB family)
MSNRVETALKEMLDISSDIDKALLFGPNDVLASNMDSDAAGVAVVQARELVRLAALRAADMGSQPMTQLVVETSSGFVFLVREPAEEGLVAMATGKRSSRVGLALYDLKTCIRDAREAMKEVDGDQEGEGEEA